jgi:hypothetical protein
LRENGPQLAGATRALEWLSRAPLVSPELSPPTHSGELQAEPVPPVSARLIFQAFTSPGFLRRDPLWRRLVSERR